MKAEKPVVLGVYAYSDDLIQGIETLKSEKIRIAAVYSPGRNESVNEALGAKPSLLRWIALAGGIAGIITGFWLSMYTTVQWNLIVSGKPVTPITPFVIVGFEFCILFSAFGALSGVLLMTRLPRMKLPAHYDPRFSIDHFGLAAFAAEEKDQRVADLLQQTGAKEIHFVQG